MNINEKQPKAAICANCIYKTISGGGTDKFYKCKDSGEKIDLDDSCFVFKERE